MLDDYIGSPLPSAQTSSTYEVAGTDEGQSIRAVISYTDAQGFDETFIRKWNYYLEYCHAGFNMRNVGVAQAIYTRPNNLSLREAR